MSQFLIQVNASAYGSTGSFRALKFCQSALDQGHTIVSVFFYQDGVYNSSALLAPASDEFDIHAAWLDLSRKHQIKLTNCVSAALRRGVLSPQEAKDNAKPQWNADAGFTMGGLGELVTGIEQAQRLVCF
ncbi:sulfurtransferase complex subunit TusD [Shewanella sp. SR44-3]|uniref:sulfurtransferase complex subunit TusD n=1 Tax=unclassified Shewanella TaxID=196818 RepID=UPI0015FB6C48|nr:sulfurtransferase complex subunit TusD [Shewanella sp. SR44-3]MBB1270548.1 sulfurtransferase complex subunit TusD [Shewanella sp. SR44-3]